MAFDVIVFNQEELLRALKQGIKSIALCDNSFTLPDTNGIEYTIIGNVTIESSDKPLPSYSSSFDTSYISSYGYSSYSGLSGSGSFTFAGSFGGSYVFGYSYAYGGSYGGSFNGSFTSSCAPLEDIIEYGSSGIIFVNGYGINLI